MKQEDLDLKSLRIFLQVAEHLSVTAAADQLGLPKSAVSKAITKLETTLACKLLERSTRVVRLTDAGEMMRARARLLLSDVSELVSELQGMRDSISGRLHIAAAPAFGRYLSQRLLPEFLALYPQVTVSLTLSYGYENLFEKGVDIAFRYGDIRDERLISKPLGVSRRIVVAGKSYVQRAQAIEHPGDLSTHDCLVLHSQEEASSWTLVKGRQTMILPVKNRFQCSDLDALKLATINNVGLSQLPLFTVQDELKSGELIAVLPDWTTPDLAFSAVYRENLYKPPKLAAFLDFIEERKALFELGLGS
jgi:DNA-binding transcriptional LysR family regulator